MCASRNSGSTFKFLCVKF